MKTQLCTHGCGLKKHRGPHRFATKCLKQKKVKIIFEKKHALKGKRHCNGEQRLDIGEYMDRAFVFDQRFVYTS